MNILFWALDISLYICSFHERVLVRVTPRVVKLDVSVIVVLLNRMGFSGWGLRLWLSTIKWVLRGLKDTRHWMDQWCRRARSWLMVSTAISGSVYVRCRLVSSAN